MWPLGCLVINSLLEIDYTCIPKPANGVRLRAKLESENPTGLPVGVVRINVKYCFCSLIFLLDAGPETGKSENVKTGKCVCGKK